ncbi:MAG: TIGR03620 family F420-dependent LLM class oxidoreductase [Acidimicrobiales bacterium]|jgi:probable F420-dependent oxidoreductase
MDAAGALRANRTGLWTGALEALPGPRALDAAAELDELGYGSLWFGEAYGREALTTALALLGATKRMVVGTGIANIYARGAMATNAASRLIEALAPGRFVLGLGVSHKPLVERDRNETYLPPVEAMAEYLDRLDSAPYLGSDGDRPPVVLAALGPRMLGLARDRTAGAHPYLVTPAHTASARATLGADRLLVVEQAVVLNQERGEGLRRAHDHLTIYTGLPNYRNSWLRQGFAEDDLVKGGTDRLADALVVQGDEAAVVARVDEHLGAGADHVLLQVLGADLGQVPMDEWRSLSPALAGIGRPH